MSARIFVKPDYMNTQQEKIKFYLDKNIWSHKIIKMSPSELEDFKNLIKPLKEQSKIEIYYSPIIVLESIKGIVSEEHFLQCQEEIMMADRISNEHILAEDPWNHVRRSAASFIPQPLENPYLIFLNLCRKIASSSYQRMEPEIKKINSLLNNWIERWMFGLNSIKSQFRKEFGFEERDENLISKAKEFKDKKSVLHRKRRHWVSFCDHFSLARQLRDFPLPFVYENFHSFRYWVNYRITYENKLLFEDWSPKRSDYLDWQQVVYLNIMDYIVTEDKGFRAILNEYAHEEKSKVAMSYDEFMRQLSELPSKRAPDTTIEEWHDAS